MRELLLSTFLLGCLCSTQGYAKDFDQLAQEQATQIQSLMQNIDQKIVDGTLSGKAGQYLSSGFGQLREMIARQVYLYAKEQLIQSYIKAWLKYQLKIHPDLELTNQAATEQHLVKLAKAAVDNYDDQLLEDVQQSMNKCKDAIKLDVVALMFAGNDNSQGMLEFQQSKDCILRESNLQRSIGAILRSQQSQFVQVVQPTKNK